MDTSKEYITMCEKANELQEIVYENMRFQNGDWFVNEYGDVKVSVQNGLPRFNHAHSVLIWLPRQDQLQEIMKFCFSGVVMFGWCKDKVILSASGLKHVDWEDSFEKGWLHLVMQRRFNKIWNATTQLWEIIKD